MRLRSFLFQMEQSQLIGAELSPPRPVRPLGKAKFNYRLNHYCRPEKVLVPAVVAEKLEITRVAVGDVVFGQTEVELRPVQRSGALVGYEIILPDIEATSGQQLSVSVTNKTRKVALFYMVAVLAILDEQKLLAAAGEQVAALAPPDATTAGPKLLGSGGER